MEYLDNAGNVFASDNPPLESKNEKCQECHDTDDCPGFSYIND